MHKYCATRRDVACMYPAVEAITFSSVREEQRTPGSTQLIQEHGREGLGLKWRVRGEG